MFKAKQETYERPERRDSELNDRSGIELGARDDAHGLVQLIRVVVRSVQRVNHVSKASDTHDVQCDLLNIDPQTMVQRERDSLGHKPCLARQRCPG